MTATTVPHPYDDAQFYDGVPLRRLMAFCLDVIISFLVVGALIAVFFVLGFLTFGLGWLVMLALLAAGDFLYRWLTIAGNSATWGMSICGIELRDRRGERLDAGQALVHTLGYYAVLVFIVGGLGIPLLITLLTVFFSPHGRLIHDFLLGTVMINRPV